MKSTDMDEATFFRYRFALSELTRLGKEIQAIFKSPADDNSRYGRADVARASMEALMNSHGDEVSRIRKWVGIDLDLDSLTEERLRSEVEQLHFVLDAEGVVPLRTAFAEWLAPLHQAAPSAGIAKWAQSLDALTLRDWAAIGDHAADFTAGLRFDDICNAVSLMMGATWDDTTANAREKALAFAEAACERAEIKMMFCGWRIRNIGLAVIGATGEMLLATRRPDNRAPLMRWFSDAFDQVSL